MVASAIYKVSDGFSSIRFRCLKQSGMRTSRLVVFLCLCVVARASCSCSCATDRIPPNTTSCGIISATNVTDFFLELNNASSRLANDYKKLREGSNDFVPTGHDPYYQYRSDDHNLNCWRYVPLPTRIYLDGLTLRNFTDPLLTLGKDEFKIGVKIGGNATNLGLRTYTLVDNLIKGISRLDCVMTLAKISNAVFRKLVPFEQQGDDSSEMTVSQRNCNLLEGLEIVVRRVHKDLQEMSGCSSSTLELPKRCPLRKKTLERETAAV